MQFDVVPPETGSVSSLGKKSVSSLGKKSLRDDSVKKKNNGAVKISPWTLARLNAEEVAKAADEARKKSKILQPVARNVPKSEPSFESSGRWILPRSDNNTSNKRRSSKRVRLPVDLAMGPLPDMDSPGPSGSGFAESSSSLAPLQLEALSAFQTSRAMSGPVGSPESSSLDSPDIQPFRVTSVGPTEPSERGMPHLSRSASDGYDASGGEDSDRVVPNRLVGRSSYWNGMGLPLGLHQDERVFKQMGQSSSSDPVNDRML